MLYMQDVMGMSYHTHYVDTDRTAVGQYVAGVHGAAGAWLLRTRNSGQNDVLI